MKRGVKTGSRPALETFRLVVLCNSQPKSSLTDTDGNSDPNGSEGELKLATTYDASNDVTDETYYRYYEAGDKRRATPAA